MEARLRPHVLDRQRQALFVAEDGLVLRTVVREHTLDVLHVRHAPEIQQEDDDAQQALKEVAHDGAVDEAVGQAGEQRRDQDEQHDRQRDAEHHGRADDDVLGLLLAEVLFDPEIDLAGLLLLVLGQQVGRIGQRLHALDHRVEKHDDAADERPAEDRVLFLDQVQLLDLLDHAVLRAADDGLLCRAAHEDALDERLPADGCAERDTGIGFCGSGFAHMVTSVTIKYELNCRSPVQTAGAPKPACRRRGRWRSSACRRSG